MNDQPSSHTAGPSMDHTWLSAREAYATELARRRERARLTLAELAERCGYDGTYLFRLESGERLGSADSATALDHAYGTGTSLLNLWRLAKRETRTRQLPEHEGPHSPLGIQEYAPATLPAALQTPAYAEAQPHLSRPGALQRLIDQTRTRLTRPTPGTAPVHYRALLDESVLHRAVRDREVWAEQVEHLIRVAHAPHVALHIVPFGAGPARILSPLQLFFFHAGPAFAFTESGCTGHLIEDWDDIEHLHRAYDATRDTALTPTATLDLLHTMPGPARQ